MSKKVREFFGNICDIFGVGDAKRANRFEGSSSLILDEKWVVE